MLRKAISRKIWKGIFIFRRDFMRVALSAGILNPIINFNLFRGQNFVKKHPLYEVLKNGVTHDRDLLADADKCKDLCFLDKIMNKRRPEVVLEFGCGLSTIIIAHAMHKLLHEGKIKKGKIYVVEASEEWVKKVESCLPKELKPLVEFVVSNVKISTYNGSLVSMYENLPDISPDFIYLDGPSPDHIQGNISGISMKNKESMAADILLYETTFRPGLFILVDGRLQNCYFLDTQLKFKYKRKHNRLSQYTTYELKHKWDFKPGVNEFALR